jgi:hypothetical protein
MGTDEVDGCRSGIVKVDPAATSVPPRGDWLITSPIALHVVDHQLLVNGEAGRLERIAGDSSAVANDTGDDDACRDLEVGVDDRVVGEPAPRLFVGGDRMPCATGDPTGHIEVIEKITAILHTTWPAIDCAVTNFASMAAIAMPVGPSLKSPPSTVG